MNEEHWIEDDQTRKRYWLFVKSDLGLTEDEAHTALGVEHTKDYTGTKEQAVAALKEFAAVKKEYMLAKKLAEQTRARAAAGTLLQDAIVSLPESPAVAWTYMRTPSGFVWSVTARAGLTDELAKMAREQIVAQILAYEEMAACHGWQPASKNGNGYRGQVPAAPRSTQSAVPQSKQALNDGPPKSKEPPPLPEHIPPASLLAHDGPPPGQGAPPAPVTEQAQSGGTGGELMTEFVKIVAPKGKPVIEFWRPNRQYAEIQYHLSAESLLGLAPELVAAGWVVAHFEDVGKEYQLPLTIEWTPSPKNPKWKDITAVRLRQ